MTRLASRWNSDSRSNEWIGLAKNERLKEEIVEEMNYAEAAFLAELQDGQFLVSEILRTSGDAEVSNGFHGCVQEKANMALFATDSNYRSQPIL